MPKPSNKELYKIYKDKYNTAKINLIAVQKIYNEYLPIQRTTLKHQIKLKGCRTFIAGYTQQIKHFKIQMKKYSN